MSVLIAKFCYNQITKKVKLNRNQLKWENVCAILMEAFLFPRKDGIKLKYKDFDDDEITVNSDEDLFEAYNTTVMTNLVKFFVYYSNVIVQNKEGQDSEYSKIERPLFSNKSLELYEKILVPEAIRNHQQNLVNTPELEKAEQKTVIVKIDSQSLQDIFNEILFTPSTITKIQKLKDQQAISPDRSVEYSVDTDYEALTKHLMNSLSDIINRNVEKDVYTNEFGETKLTQENKELLNASLKESIYENSDQNEPYIVNSVKGPQIKSLSSSLECQNLASSMGVKLSVKYENGKAKFVSIPVNEYYLIEQQQLKGSRSSSKTKTTAERKESGLSNISIRSETCDFESLDDSKIVKKNFKRIEDSVYEKIY